MAAAPMRTTWAPAGPLNATMAASSAVRPMAATKSARRDAPPDALGTESSSLSAMNSGSASSGSFPSAERTGETGLRGWPEGTDQASRRTRAIRLRPSRELVATDDSRGPIRDPRTLASEPGVRRTDRPHVFVDRIQLQARLRERGLSVGDRQSCQREPDGEEDDQGVVELPRHRDDARHEVDGRDEVRRPGEERRLARPRQPLVSGKAPGQARIARQATEQSREAVARKRVARARRRQSRVSVRSGCRPRDAPCSGVG